MKNNHSSEVKFMGEDLKLNGMQVGIFMQREGSLIRSET